MRYLVQKYAQAVDVLTEHFGTNTTFSVAEAFNIGYNAAQKPLTTTVVLAGAAMSPTLNPRAASDPVPDNLDFTETLLVRKLWRPSPATIFSGDVVLLKNPYSSDNMLVRRVAAGPGEELIDDTNQIMLVPPQHVWVVADNENLDPLLVIDSRKFGPLPMQNIVGRILYAASSRIDHGPVENSEPAMRADAPVLEAELDLEQLL